MQICSTAASYNHQCEYLIQDIVLVLLPSLSDHFSTCCVSSCRTAVAASHVKPVPKLYRTSAKCCKEKCASDVADKIQHTILNGDSMTNQSGRVPHGPRVEARPKQRKPVRVSPNLVEIGRRTGACVCCRGFILLHFCRCLAGVGMF